MAHSDRLAHQDKSMRSRMSRVSRSMRGPTHKYPVGSKAYLRSLPADAVELIYRHKEDSLLVLLKHLKSRRKLPRLRPVDPGDQDTASGLVILVGGDYQYLRSKRHEVILDKINYMARRTRRNVLLVSGPNNHKAEKGFTTPSIYRPDGYFDWGINYTPKMSSRPYIGVASDVCCFWNSAHDFATVVIPANPTLGGVLKAKTVMRKADVMISHYPPYEAIEGTEDKYTEEEIKRILLVSEARKIWDPETHYYGGIKVGNGYLQASGDKRMLSLGGRRNTPVVRWSRGDLEKGPISGPGGYPINESIYYS